MPIAHGAVVSLTPHMRSLVAVAVAFVLVVAACGAVPGEEGSVVDHWPVGPARTCSGDQAERCEALVGVGRSGLDERNPGHPAIVSLELHQEGPMVDPSTGDKMLVTRSGGCCSVLVMRLQDGSTTAIGVGYPGISQVPMAFPWGP
jgi:hypothetical protein